jgi:hypothetical protein
MSAVEHFIELLERIGQVEWYRCVGGRSTSGRVLPPLVVWRFTPPEADLGERVAAVVGRHDGTVPWSCARPGRNWVLTPTRVAERDVRGATDMEVLISVADEDPGFAVAAAADFEKLTDEIADALGWLAPPRGPD